MAFVRRSAVVLLLFVVTHHTDGLSPRVGPFRGINTWLSFCGRVNETKLLSMADAMASQLLPSGYEYFGLDAGWSLCASGDCSSIAPNYSDPQCCGVGHGMDEYGRPLPKPEMYPSSGAYGELGLKKIIDQVHALGLKFQLRMQRGITVEAVQQRTKVLGTPYTADQIVDWQHSCGQWGVSEGWGGIFVGINTTHPGGQAYYQSVVDLWASWGVDGIEADDFFGGSGKGNHSYDCSDYPYLGETELLATAIRRSSRPDMELSIMPGNGAIPASGQAVAAQHWATSYRVTSDFHDDRGDGSACANPRGCWGVPGSSIVLDKCNPEDNGQKWKWMASRTAGWGGFVMPYSAGGILCLGCRKDTNHDCSPGDDLDLWHFDQTVNQIFDDTSRPTLSKEGVLRAKEQPGAGTCVAVSGNGLLRMAACSSGVSAQEWKLVQVPGEAAGVVQIQSVGESSLCILGSGGHHNDSSPQANWPPVEQFAQSALFAPLIGLNGTFVNLDDLPLGATGRGTCSTPPEPCLYSYAEQRSLFTLYVMVRSPIMFSGDLPTDDTTLSLVTNPEVLAVQEHSRGNRQLFNVAHCGSPSSSYQCSQVAWAANVTGSQDFYLALFWTGTGNQTVSVPLASLDEGLAGKGAALRDLWARTDMPNHVAPHGSVSAILGEHETALLKLSPLE